MSLCVGGVADLARPMVQLYAMQHTRRRPSALPSSPASAPTQLLSIRLARLQLQPQMQAALGLDLCDSLMSSTLEQGSLAYMHTA